MILKTDNTHPNTFYPLILLNFLCPVLLTQFWVVRDLDADLLSIAWFCGTVHFTVSVTLLVNKIPSLFYSL